MVLNPTRTICLQHSKVYCTEATVQPVQCVHKLTLQYGTTDLISLVMTLIGVTPCKSHDKTDKLV